MLLGLFVNALDKGTVPEFTLNPHFMVFKVVLQVYLTGRVLSCRRLFDLDWLNWLILLDRFRLWMRFSWLLICWLLYLSSLYWFSFFSCSSGWGLFNCSFSWLRIDLFLPFHDWLLLEFLTVHKVCEYEHHDLFPRIAVLRSEALSYSAYYCVKHHADCLYDTLQAPFSNFKASHQPVLLHAGDKILSEEYVFHKSR